MKNIFWISFLLKPAILRALKWPSVQVQDSERLPNIELSLAPPTHPWPQVTASIANLESSREKLEDASMNKLQIEFNRAAVVARQRLGETFGRMLKQFDDPSLLKALMVSRHGLPNSTLLRQLPQDTLGSEVLAVRVNVLPVSPPDASLKEQIDTIEHKRSEAEKKMFQSALGEVKSLTDFMINELEAQLHVHLDPLGVSRAFTQRQSASFLEHEEAQLPAQSHVRIVPNDVAYPTVESMVQAMETRRDTTENLARQRVFEKELDFLMVCNRAMEEGLRSAVDRALAQYDTVLKSLA